MDLQAALGAGRWVAGPQPVGQEVRGEHAVGVHREEGQEGSLFRRSDRHGLPGHDEFHGPEDVQPHGSSLAASTSASRRIHAWSWCLLGRNGPAVLDKRVTALTALPTTPR
jgi:hypothetical protein